MKKIAIVHNLTGGGAVRVLDETNKILSRKYAIKYFSPPKINTNNKHLLQIIWNYVRYVYKTLPDYYRDTSKVINNGKYKAVIIHHDTYLKAPPLLNNLRIKSIYILHEPPREFYEPIHFHAPLIRDKLFTIIRIPVAIFDRVTTKRASYVIANSRFSKNKIDDIYGIESIAIYPGFSSKITIKRRCKKRKYLCLSVGSLLPYKGHELTIKAIGRMKNKPELVIVGDGREVEKNKLKKLAMVNEVSLTILKKLSDKKLINLYNSAHVYVNSAYQEPFGLTSLEALSFGGNLVTVNDCGTQELKKYFDAKVSVVNRTPKSISAGITKMMKKKNFDAQIPAVFNWRYYANELIKLIDNG